MKIKKPTQLVVPLISILLTLMKSTVQLQSVLSNQTDATLIMAEANLVLIRKRHFRLIIKSMRLKDMRKAFVLSVQMDINQSSKMTF